MRGLRLFLGILLGFLLLSGSISAQNKLSVKEDVGTAADAKSVKAKAASAETSSKAEAGSTSATTSVGASTKATGIAQPASQVKAAAAATGQTTGGTGAAAVEATGEAKSSSAEPPEGAAGQTTTSAEPDKGADASTYSVRLRDLEQRINELKEQVFRSKARLSLLAETILQGAVAGSQARLVHENKMGASYLLVKAVYALDGAPIFNKMDEEGGLNDRDTFDIYNGSMVPGEHTVTANLEYRGRGFGIFSYLKGYRFKVKSSYTFNAPEGKAITVRVVSYEKGGPTAPLEDRPAIRYVERVAATGSAAESDKGGK